MWRNPSLLLDSQAEFLAVMLGAEPDIVSEPYPFGNWGIVADSLRGHQYFRHVHEELQAITHEAADERALRASIVKFLLQLAHEIERKRDYSLFPALNNAFDELRVTHAKYAVLPMTINLVLQLLVGNEERLLFGTRGGNPAWKYLSNPITRKIPMVDPIHTYPAQEIAYLDQSDADLMPEPGDWLTGLPISYDWPQVDIHQVYQILEQAYYNQRYTVYPEGALVKLRHFNPIKRVVLKVKSPGLHDPNYVDFVVQFEVDTTVLERALLDLPPGSTRKSLMVFDGSIMVGGGQFFHADEQEGRGQVYLAWVTALIYHDLVTAEEVGGERRVVHIGPRTTDTDRGEEEPSWVYIPRRVRRQRVPPRIPSDTPRFITPHHVRGHRRRGNPTERHLRRLEEFERVTGLRILDLLRRNPGYTFVRPYISPSEEGVRDLPRFIHARLQSDIERLMQPPLGERN